MICTSLICFIHVMTEVYGLDLPTHVMIEFVILFLNLFIRAQFHIYLQFNLCLLRQSLIVKVNFIQSYSRLIIQIVFFLRLTATITHIIIISLHAIFFLSDNLNLIEVTRTFQKLHHLQMMMAESLESYCHKYLKQIASTETS